MPLIQPMDRFYQIELFWEKTKGKCDRLDGTNPSSMSVKQQNYKGQHGTQNEIPYAISRILRKIKANPSFIPV